MPRKIKEEVNGKISCYFCFNTVLQLDRNRNDVKKFR